VLEGGVSGSPCRKLPERVGTLGGSRKLRLGQLQGFDLLAQRDGAGVIADLLDRVCQLGNRPRNMLTARDEPGVLIAVGVRL
jgi:hypothetical protein